MKTGRRRAAAAGLAVLAGLALALAWPAVVDAAVASFGLRAVALTLAVAAAATALVGGSTAVSRPYEPVLRSLRAGIALVAAVAWSSDSAVPLRLIPAGVYLALAWVFGRSLSGRHSIIEQAAMALEPAVPDFIAPYCRRVTVLWTVLFVAMGVVLAVLAVAAPEPVWSRAAGPGAVALFTATSVVEYFIRKSYFRYYWYGGPFDRFWSRLFPSEATEMGRRTQRYIDEMRARRRQHRS